VNAKVDEIPDIKNEELRFTVTLSCTVSRFYLREKNVSNQVYIITPGQETIKTM